MKKLSALILSIILIGFLSTNVFAQCGCGYLYELGPGTITQYLDFGNLPAVGIRSYNAVATCGDWALTQTIPTQPYYNPNEDAYQGRVILQPGPDGSYQTGDDTALQFKSFMLNHGNTSTWGTGTIAHYNPSGSCPVTIEQAQYQIRGIFTDQSKFGSTQTSVCDIDPAATSIGADQADTNSVFNILNGYVTADPTVGIELIMEGPLQSKIPMPWPTNVQLIHNIQRVRAEYYSILREDVNNNGIADGGDFFAVNAAISALAAKSCHGTFYYN